MTAQESPVSWRVNVRHLAPKGVPVWLEADERQREELARQHGLLAVNAFRFDLVLSRWHGDGVRVAGEVKAEIVQECVVTLEPLTATIAEPVEAILVPEGSRLARPDFNETDELLLDAEGADLPETFSGDEVDAGALAEEFFALAIDPYPRKPGASLETGAEKTVAGPLQEQLGALLRKR